MSSWSYVLCLMSFVIRKGLRTIYNLNRVKFIFINLLRMSVQDKNREGQVGCKSDG